MFSHCYPTEEVPKSKFEITMKMFTTLAKARNEISLLKQRRLEIKALNQKEMFVLNENSYYYRLKKRSRNYLMIFKLEKKGAFFQSVKM